MVLYFFIYSWKYFVGDVLVERLYVIYGAGDYGQRTYHFLKEIGVEVSFFCQSYVENGKKVLGLPVVKFADLVSTKDEIVFFLSISNKEVCRQIRLHIESVFLDRVTIIDCSSFFEENNFVDRENVSGYCNLCNKNVSAFLPGGLQGIEKVKLFKEHHIIGGGYRKFFSCPACGGIDRERWQVWVLSKYTNIFSASCRVLHFAPEEPVSKYISANQDCDYYTGDIVLGRAMHKTDITDIQYKDGFFDFVIMNHVLEHIDDMEQAMREVKRVMKKNGKLIISFPICMDQDTLELPNITSDADRLEYYGQEDHVRLFGRDYVQRIADFGFSVTVYSPNECCTEKEIERYGFIHDDVLMICSII